MTERIITISGLGASRFDRRKRLTLGGLAAFEDQAAHKNKPYHDPSWPKGAQAYSVAHGDPFDSPTGYIIGSRVLPSREIYLVDVGEVLSFDKKKFGVSIIKMVFYKMDGTPWTLEERDQIHSEVDKGNRWQVVWEIPTSGPYFGIYVAPAGTPIAEANRSAMAEALRSAREIGREAIHAGTEVAKAVIETGGEVLKKTAAFGQTTLRALTIAGIVAAIGVTAYAVNKATGGALFGGGGKREALPEHHDDKREGSD